MELAHLPRDLWTSRFARERRERAPRLIETAKGTQWIAGNMLLGSVGRRRLRDNSEQMSTGNRLAETDLANPGETRLRLQDMDKDGVDAEVMFGILGMGQKVRDAVPVAAWTRPCPPEVFREEVKRAVEQGYTIFKMHSDAKYDVIEQTKAAEEVAPPGFKIHWDFNHNRCQATILPIISELERNHPIVGFIEDPLPWADIDGWRTLRARTRIPLIMHVPQLGGIQEIIRGVADIYMVGNGGIGNTLISGFAYGKANIQTLIQQSGNTLMKALALHMAAVLPTASAHIVTLADQYDEDITTEMISVDEGFSRVPEGPGLGVEVDEAALAKTISRTPIERSSCIGVLQLPGGHRVYSKGDPAVQRFTGYEEGAIRGVKYERWEDDGSEKFRQIQAQLEKRGPFMEIDK